VESWWEQAWARLQPVAPAPDGATTGLVVLAVVVAALVVPPLWRATRVLVTVVHELGHGLVGVAVGRRFTGLVLRADMSGHAVTVGPARGAGLVLSTWAGYPAPAAVGAVALHLATAGWAGPVLGATTAVLLAALVRVRSLYTSAVVVALVLATAALWWWGGPLLRAQVLAGLGLFLLLGAWRHVGALLRRPGRGSDPAVLARLTRVPAALWVLSFVVVLAAASWWALAPVRLLSGW
jgi:hypothetical protein